MSPIAYPVPISAAAGPAAPLTGRRGQAVASFARRGDRAEMKAAAVGSDPDGGFLVLPQVSQVSSHCGHHRRGKPRSTGDGGRPTTVPRTAGGRPGRIPPLHQPLRARAAADAPSGLGWLHEIKVDGYRVQAHVRGGTARIVTRNGFDWTDRFPSVAALLVGDFRRPRSTSPPRPATGCCARRCSRGCGSARPGPERLRRGRIQKPAPRRQTINRNNRLWAPPTHSAPAAARACREEPRRARGRGKATPTASGSPLGIRSPLRAAGSGAPFAGTCPCAEALGGDRVVRQLIHLPFAPPLDLGKPLTGRTQDAAGRPR